MALPRVMASGFAPGKCILFGEHAVVYGHPAVAVAIESGVRVSVEQSNEWTLEGVAFEPSRHPHISHILDTVFEYDGSPLKMEVESIPAVDFPYNAKKLIARATDVLGFSD